MLTWCIKDSLDSSSTTVVGPTVRSFHFYNDMSFFVSPPRQLSLPKQSLLRLCPPVVRG